MKHETAGIPNDMPPVGAIVVSVGKQTYRHGNRKEPDIVGELITHGSREAYIMTHDSGIHIVGEDTVRWASKEERAEAGF